MENKQNSICTTNAGSLEKYHYFFNMQLLNKYLCIFSVEV